MAKSSPDACLRCDAGEQTCIIYRAEHVFAVRTTLASTRLFWRLVMILIEFLVKFGTGAAQPPDSPLGTRPTSRESMRLPRWPWDR